LLNTFLILALILTFCSAKLKTKQLIDANKNYAVVNKSNGNVVRFNAKLQKLYAAPLDSTNTNYWKFEFRNDGTYLLRSVAANTQVMTVNNISYAEGAYLWTNDFWGGGNQMWYVDSIGGNEIMLRVKHTQKCMAIAGDIVQIGCNRSDPRQVWTVREQVVQPIVGVPLQSGVNYAVVNKSNGYVVKFNVALQKLLSGPLDGNQINYWTFNKQADDSYLIRSTANAAQVMTVNLISYADYAFLWTNVFWGGQNQQWFADGINATEFMLRAKHSGKCMALIGDIVQVPCNRDDTRQIWKVTPQAPSPIVDGQDYMIVNDNNGACVRFKGHITVLGHEQCNPAGNDYYWNFKKNPDGAYHIMSKALNEVITVKDISYAEGYAVWNNVIWGGDNQKWFVEFQTGGQFILRAKHSQKCLSSNPVNTAAQQFSCNAGDRKQLYIVRPRPPPGQMITGIFIDATTGKTVPATLFSSTQATFTSNETGQVYQATISPNMSYTNTIPSGTYTMTTNIAGYITATTPITVGTGSVTQNVVISPVVQGSRIVLTWGNMPTDMDLYCQDTVTNEVIFFRNKVVDVGKFDVDDTNSFGPETITLTDAATHKYKILVKNYSKEVPLSASGAKVEVYAGNALIASIEVPTGSGANIAWEVLEYDSANRSVTTTNRFF